MATITKYKLNGIDYTPPREWAGTEILATFDGDSVQANITTSEFSFVNDAKNAIDLWMASTPTEGIPLEVSVSNETTTYGAFSGYLDFRTLQYLSDIEATCGIKQDNGIASLDTRLRGITMELLQQKGAYLTSDFCHIPYIVENRKTLLEKVYLLAQAYSIVKTGVDEVHKIINIASDITSAGIVQALVNLTVTLVNLVLLINRLVDLLQEIQDSFFPPIRYHKGISLYTAILRAVSYCGYSLQMDSTLATIMQKYKLCPSKSDEIGALNTSSTASGILKPQDFGYVASDLFALANRAFFTKVAIQGNTVILRTWNDPFWIQSSSYTMPNVKVEQAFINNGSWSPNYNELDSSRILEYTRDESDLWTLTNVNDQISVTTVSPVVVNNQSRVLLTGSEQINIPYALCVRKDVVDELLDEFLGTASGLDQIKNTIEIEFNSVAGILGTAFPALGNFIDTVMNRTGCLKVENHFFSLPKVVYLETNNRIPENYADIIGAIALSNNYHSYKSFVPGVRNPLNPADTNAKYVYTGVTIPFGINDFNTLINNSYFTTVNGQVGKFTSIKWLPDKDKAECDFWIQTNWAVNLQENTI